MVEITAVLATILSAAIGGVLPLLQEVVRAYLRRHPEKRKALASPTGRSFLRLLGLTGEEPVSGASLFAKLAKASAEMDGIVKEIERFTNDRQAAISNLETQLFPLCPSRSRN